MSFSILGREPVRWVGIIVAVVAAVVGALLGEGVISDVLAGQITDLTANLAGVLILLLPIITTEIARRGATSVAQPSLPIGTDVIIRGTNDEPPGNAVVVRK
jgi:hypothetical protein